MSYDIQSLYNQIKNKKISHEDAAKRLYSLMAQRAQTPAPLLENGQHDNSEAVSSTRPGEVGELQEKTIRYVRRLLATVIELPVERIEADVPLEKYGMDSILSME